MFGGNLGDCGVLFFSFTIGISFNIDISKNELLDVYTQMQPKKYSDESVI